MAKFSQSDIGSLRYQYWGEVLAPVDNPSLNQKYWGLVQGIQIETPGTFPLGMYIALSSGWTI